MKSSEQRLSEARRQHTEAVVAHQVHQLLQRVPMLSGFWRWRISRALARFLAQPIISRSAASGVVLASSALLRLVTSFSPKTTRARRPWRAA
jgi:hypothetical protein